ncbi:sugar lactone lactonase YvrE [Saccharothrix tamanrassetensis]|uniref:Sugar lactone lactonase YvrE n=1 Tax=Saccharothrix tamanrassetensis TaxID=1051531 RepID=A0A841CA39_9PSEU|nr:SMP-30/gluconolactonase/LRE family protein [Saccharothrix tamanrassetensis]MBB5954269.1 sugar lactone lactonase YvrE [Saccharothrix tamanrassetensis]
MSRMSGVLAAVVVGLSLVAAAPASAASAHDPLPTELPLPNGFRPEGIAIGSAPVAYLGSLADGDLLRLDLRTGKGEVFSQGPGTPSVGLKVDRRGRLFVAGGNGGDARVVDARNGAILKSYKFAGPGAFVNDVVVTDDAAYFTDSSKALLYKIAFGPHGRLPDTYTAVPLTGDFVLNPGFNANGIAETPDGKALLVVQSNTGQLHRVVDGVTKVVDLGGEVLTAGDGLLVRGRTLYVVRNALNTVAVFTLDRAGTSGKLVAKITDPRFDVPTTVAAFGNRLYLPNARFTTPPTPTTTYNVVAVPNR